ncbi:MAG: ADP-dependent NAD(P)H-hydrate dehydratase / NAD(P)H-hydrate epimerase [Gaiellaceae bacterium]|nr:ADP-dependent NAD(P)H-hydrate dehydratase / NAD(P)H-hydrate epimerase [Gaiellaceae bacterium]
MRPSPTEPLYTAEEMRAAEAGHDVAAMMQCAGAAVAEEVMRRWPDARRVAIYAGGGANGGDGEIAGELLRAAGREIVDERPDVIIDALLGTGMKGAPRDDTARVIEQINGAGVPVVAVDIPSGVNASTGEVAGAAVRADVTVTMHGPKVGLAVAPGRFLAGEVVVADIGLEAGETANALVTPSILDEVPRRSAGDNKYTSGHVLVVGGSPGMTGAAALCARAALRADAGYVTICAPAESVPVIEELVVEAVKRPLEEVFAAAEKADALALGPGLGRDPETLALVRRLLAEAALPAVVDADALFELEPGDWPAPRVLTPHEGELGRLLGRDSKKIAAHRLASVQEAAARFDAVVVLKGEDSLVAAPGGGVLVCALGLPSLATAGTGDVLTGITAAFLAKGMEPQRAAAAACAAQQLASRAAPQRAGLVASDVIEALPSVLAG